MCGAFEQHNAAMHRWAEILADWPSEEKLRLNLRPTMLAGTVDSEGYRERSWSLIPQWAKEPKLKYSTFNARAEGLKEKPTFRDAWKRSQRCIVPASAYFEWPVVDGKKVCHRISMPEEEPLLLGGLWETWSQGENVRETFTIITTAAGGDIEWVHHRTPLLITQGDIDCWLNGEPEEAKILLEPRSKTGLLASPISSPPKT